MDVRLNNFIESLKSLRQVIEDAELHEDGFKAYGWNQIHLGKENIIDIIDNQISKLMSYGDNPLTKGLNSTIDYHTQTIKALTSNAEEHFIDESSYLISCVPNILLTLNYVFSDIDYELFSYDNIQDKKLLPRGLSARLRSVDKQLDSIEETTSGIKDKISVINEAHDAAESLPTDLASLKEAKQLLDSLVNNGKYSLKEALDEIEKIKTKIIKLENDAFKSAQATEQFEIYAKDRADSAELLVQKCDQALQITTTQGLAAGFDQKAKELKDSIWVWIFMLLVALGAGAWVGSERVDVFTAALNSNLTAGQAILHTIMSVFSIGGPLWLAWISTQQINQRFKLAEDYSYKATVAKSFTGFKKFAERFEPETEERLFNSTLDRLDEMPLRLIQNKDYNSPWHEFVDSDSFKKALDMVPALAKEASKFANRTSLKQKTTAKTASQPTQAATEPTHTKPESEQTIQ